MNPTLNYPPGYLEAVPYIDAPEEVGIINNLVDGSICISKADWDSFEASWTSNGTARAIFSGTS